MNGSDDTFSTFGDVLYVMRKHKEKEAMKTQRMHANLFLILGSLFLLMIFVGLTGCAGPADDEDAGGPGSPSDRDAVTESGVTEQSDSGGPAETTEAFYAWYFDYIGEPGGDNFRNPLAERAYGESEYLTARLIRAVDNLQDETYGGFPYDPFLQAQDFPLETSVEAWEESENSATVIVHQLWGENVSDLTVDLVKEDGRWLIDQIRRGNRTTPDGTAELFYRWYLAYARGSEGLRNPLADRAYRESEYLSQNYIQKVDEILASAGGGSYDPFLQAQDIPVAVQVAEIESSGDKATVTMERYWGGNAAASPIRVALEKVDGRWLITDVTGTGQAPALLPAEVVEAFYAQWRLAVRGDMGNGTGSALTEGAYRNSNLLSDDFKTRVDDMVAGMGHGGFDPFLCAQDVPEEIAPVTTFMGPKAHVLVTTTFDNHAFTVVLALKGTTAWQIEDVICAGTPVGATTAFYTWYLGYPGDPARSTNRSPLADDAYRQAPFVSAALIEETEALLKEMGQTPGAYDPFIQAQDYATAFEVSATGEQEQVLVTLFFGNPADRVGHTLGVTLVEEDGRWLLRFIERAEADGEAGTEAVLEQALADLAEAPQAPAGEVVSSEEYGFRFQIPAGWVAQPMDLDAPGMPDDWPVEAGYLIMPASLADEMGTQSGPPSPDAAALVAPFSVELVLGEQRAFDRAFVPAFSSEETRVGGLPVTVAQVGRSDAVVRYTFHDERGGTRWVVFQDLVSGFPGRAQQAAEVEGILPGILATFAFAE